ncbi:WD repeat-containing protein 49 [Xyrichtys novacula]|uniref:WD repeat-containing protein 49 n=1 Tax=Xyrichtys novacula TaxID=13765 RepID=A0AAV1H4M4_XYRNO|nr:WD repeat-containing protein 49 [Xyrichtys novacula]
MDTSKKHKNRWIIYETEVPHSRFCDAASGVSPAEKLTTTHLQLLRNVFTCPRDGAQVHQNRPCERRRENRGGKEEQGMKLEEFREVVKSVVGSDIEDSWIERFFNEVDCCCSGEMSWQKLVSYLQLEYTERERSSIPRSALLDTKPQIIHCLHNKRQPTVRVLAVSHPPPLRYISVSKGGQVTVWNSSLHILKSAGLAGDLTEEVANTRRFRGWTTDAVYMGNFHKVAIATDCRDLHFVDISTASVFEDVQLFGFRSVPTALCYWHDAQHLEQPSLLLLGDEKGGIHLMRFLSPPKGLFKSRYKREKHPQRIFLPDLHEHSDMVTYSHFPNVHKEPINRVMFEPRTNVVMASSESDDTSVVFMNISLKQEPYIWKVKQGSKCFDYSESLQLMATGGCDRTITLWTRFVTSSPVATLRGHKNPVLDVAIYEPVEQILSYSRDAELRVWDISSHQCLKILRLHFPCLQPGRLLEHGNFPFLLLHRSPLLQHDQPHLIIACKDYLALLHLCDTRRGAGGWLTDEGEERRQSVDSGPALSCALYNSTLRQVVSGHVDSSVCVWDVETGRKRLKIENAHGEEELTCMTLDSSHRRLITGASNGTIKVWNLLNGLNLHKLEPVTQSEVSGFTCLHDNQLLAVGGSQWIIQYNISATKDLYVRADMTWKSSRVHKSDILGVCQCSALGVIATASYDGEVIIWKLETQGPLFHLQRKTEREALPPVDCLLFLQHRAGNRKLRNRGVLVSSQAGTLRFWSVTGQTYIYGQFLASEEPGDHVLSLSSDQLENTILVCGDKTGRIQIWDISKYGLEIPNTGVCEHPPLLQCWRAHRGAIVSVEVLDVADRLFVLIASADGSAGLWTVDGDQVGSFGQEVKWNIYQPATYKRGTQKKLTEGRTESEDVRRSEVKDRVPEPVKEGQTSEEKCCSKAHYEEKSQGILHIPLL